MKSKNEELSYAIYRWCKKRNLWGDNTIYFDNKAISNLSEWNGEKGKRIAEDLYEYENKNPTTYFEFANPHTVSMSYEGKLNHTLNGHTPGYMKVEADLQKLFEKYGYYYTYGHSWNLTAYEL